MKHWFQEAFDELASAKSVYEIVTYVVTVVTVSTWWWSEAADPAFATGNLRLAADVVALGLAVWWMRCSFCPPANMAYRRLHAVTSAVVATLVVVALAYNLRLVGDGVIASPAPLSRHAVIAACWAVAASSWANSTTLILKRSDGQFFYGGELADRYSDVSVGSSYTSTFTANADDPIKLRRWYLGYRGKRRPITPDGAFRIAARKSDYFFRVVYTGSGVPVGYWQLVSIPKSVYSDFIGQRADSDLLRACSRMSPKHRHRQQHFDLSTKYAIDYPEHKSTEAGRRPELYLYLCGIICSRRPQWIPEPSFQRTKLFAARADALRIDLLLFLLELTKRADINICAYTDSRDGDRLAEWCNADVHLKLDQWHTVYSIGMRHIEALQERTVRVLSRRERLVPVWAEGNRQRFALDKGLCS